MDPRTNGPGDEDLKRALEESERRYRELSTLAYSAAHDLRAPVRSINGYSEVLLSGHADRLSEEGKGYLRRMQESSRRMAGIIDALLKLISLARAEIRREEVDLSAAASAAADALLRGDSGREVEFVIQPGLKAIGDPALLDELLEQLLGNAWKFTSRHPRARIEFGSTVRGGETAYFVRDDGAGFDPLRASKLFTPFERLHGDAEFPGVGAGLGIVARIADLHGGRVEAEAEIEKGATFFFTLPAAGAAGRVNA